MSNNLQLNKRHITEVTLIAYSLYRKVFSSPQAKVMTGTYCRQQGLSEAESHSAGQEIPCLYELEHSVPSSSEPANGAYCENRKSSSQIETYFIKIHLRVRYCETAA
jgi:hypothetical protein